VNLRQKIFASCWLISACLLSLSLVQPPGGQGTGIPGIDGIRQDPAEQFSLLHLRFERFQLLSDSLGRGVGDRFLIAIAQRIQAQMRPSDLLVPFKKLWRPSPAAAPLPAYPSADKVES